MIYVFRLKALSSQGLLLLLSPHLKNPCEELILHPCEEVAVFSCKSFEFFSNLIVVDQVSSPRSIPLNISVMVS